MATLDITFEQKKTDPKKDYWGSGAYQQEYEALWEELVPPSDMAKTIHGELIRSCGRLLHDYMNNGNCNAVEQETEDCPECDGCGWEEEYDDDGERIMETDCHWCGGECQVDAEKVIDQYYLDMLDFIEYHCDIECGEVDRLKDFMTSSEKGYSNYDFDETENPFYNDVIDMVVHFCLTSENKPNPDYVEPTIKK